MRFLDNLGAANDCPGSRQREPTHVCWRFGDAKRFEVSRLAHMQSENVKVMSERWIAICLQDPRLKYHH